MNILAMGLTMWGGMDGLQRYQSKVGHEVRHLAVSDPAHYHFLPHETASEVIERIAREWPPDVLLCFCPEFYPPPRAVEWCPIKTVAVISDWNLYQPQLEYNVSRFDLLLTDRLGAQCLKVPGITPRFFEPLYAHRSLIHRRLDLPRDIDIMFLGNLNHAIHRRRGCLLERVAALSDRYRVVISGGYPPEEYARRMNQARIVVNHAVRREMNLRCFEGPACGAMLFQEANNLEAHDWYEDGHHAVFYTPDNIAEKLQYYLEHEEERARIAEQGWRRAQELAAEHRMDRLFDWVARQPMAERSFSGLPEKTRIMAEIMMLASSQVSEQADALMPVLEEALHAYPGDVGFKLVAGCAALSGAGATDGPRRGELAREALLHFHEATQLAPNQAVPWLNLAIVARQAQRGALETQALEMAFEATAAEYGGLLLGRVSDPYYAECRLALALGELRPGLFHGMAACRLAMLALESAQGGRGLHWARRSIEACGQMGEPYRLAAIACSQMGDLEGAARYLEDGLAFTPFDVPHRMDLVKTYNAMGRQDEAQTLARDSARIFQACADKAPAAAEFSALAEGGEGV